MVSIIAVNVANQTWKTMARKMSPENIVIVLGATGGVKCLVSLGIAFTRAAGHTTAGPANAILVVNVVNLTDKLKVFCYLEVTE